MKSNQVNKIMIAASTLLLAALIIRLSLGAGLVLDILLTIAALVAGYPIFIKALQASKMKQFSIELLVVIAVAGAIIIGEYFEAAAVTFLFLFGAFLENKTLEKSRSSLRSLMNMAPLQATVIRNENRLTIPAEEVVENDHVIIQTGEKIPVDGHVVFGNATVNESAITGESKLINKEKGHMVFSGSILDNGYLEVVAESVGDATTFSKIIELVEEAQEGKAKTQRFLEKFASYYTPAIVIISILVGLITKNSHLALTFLVIACPGALVISAPVSIVAGIGHGARKGILIKGGEVMEKMSKINGIAFDKTGTITAGKPMVTGLKSMTMAEADLLQIVAEAELHSEHHLAKAIVDEATKRKIQLIHRPLHTEVLKGRGISAIFTGQEVYIGNRKGLMEKDIRLSPQLKKYAEREEKKGHTAVFVAVNQAIEGVISIADRVRDEASFALQRLHDDGITHQVMLTGDNEHTAQLIGASLGIQNVYANLLPEDKYQKVKTCMGKGTKLAMVGDGVNDAPSLAAADVGIAMGGSGTDIAMETADVVLMSDNLNKISYALNLSKATIRNMKQNVYFAVSTVIVLLFGVLAGEVNLASGMLIHEMSVLLVILNAIRLVNYRPGRISLNLKSLFTKKLKAFDENHCAWC